MSLPALELQKAFPYVVVRWMAAAYGVRQVQFVADESAVSRFPRLLVIVHITPFDGERLVESARAALLDRVVADVVRSGLRQCVAFTPDDSAFVERDGSRRFSSHIPSGGVRLDSIQPAEEVS